MSSLKLQGDLSDIDEEQQNFIVKVLEDLGYKNNKVTVAALGKAGDNFAANVKRITVEKDNGKPLKLVAKIAPQHLQAREMMNTKVMFQNETVMYNELFPKYSQLEKQHDIPKEERFVYPVCFGANKTAPHEVLILEDMTEYGYETKDKMVPLDIETVKLVLKSFAHFHSLSFALKNQNPEAYTSVKDGLGSMWEAMIQNKNFEQMFMPMEQQVIAMLDSEISKQKCKGLFKNLPVDQLALYNSDLNRKETVILQGDGWTNNFLFKTEEGTPTSCLMIDYQLSRISHPVGDLLYMIFCCTDYELIKVHFNDWIDYYYSELEKALSTFGLKIQSELPRDKFDEDVKNYGRCSVSMSILVALVTMREASESQDFKSDLGTKTTEEIAESMNVSHLKQATMMRIVGRVRGIVAAAIERGFL